MAFSLKLGRVKGADVLADRVEPGFDLGRPLAGGAPWNRSLALLFFPLAVMWIRLLDNLRLEWATDPQYGYGWAVPFLCAGLMVRSLHRTGPDETRDQSGPGKSFALLFIALALLYLPTRLVEGATPEWRPVQWLLGVETVGLTLCAVYLARGPRMLHRVAFPVAFFLVAVPWPTMVEAPIIQGLSRFNAGMVVEVLGWMGVPAIQHGNVIEVSTGLVGVDDACSGIRSFQSSLMISLFWGEYYRLRPLRRWLLVAVSFVLAIAFNVFRTSGLTFVAARNGTATLAQYHDDAGLAILLACFAVTWFVALLLKRGNRPDGPEHEMICAPSRLGSAAGGWCGRVGWIAAGLTIWLVAVELTVLAWYHARESQLQPGPAWSVVFPVENPSFKALAIPEKTERLLRYDEGRQGQWYEPDGTLWQAFYFDWRPGRVAGYLAKRHEPEVCLPATGITLRSGPELTMLNVHNIALPMRSYVFETPNGPLNVYQCRWEAGASRESYVAEDAARYNLVRAVWAGRGKQGQKVLEIVVTGISDPQEAKAALVKELDKMVKVDARGTPTQTQAAMAEEPKSSAD